MTTRVDTVVDAARARVPRWPLLYGGWLWLGAITLLTDAGATGRSLAYGDRVALAAAVLMAAVFGATVQVLWRADPVNRLTGPSLVLLAIGVLLLVPVSEVYIPRSTVGAVLGWIGGVVLAERWLRHRDDARARRP